MQVPVLRSTLAVLAIDLVAAALLGAALGCWPGGPDLVVLLGALVVYRHGVVLRWRSPSLLLCGCLLTSCLSFAALLVLDVLGVWSPWVASPWPLLLAPVCGHALARLVTCAMRTEPVRLTGFGRARRLCKAALLATPGSSYRIATDAGAPALEVPAARWGDRTILLRTPRGDVALFPEGPEQGMGLAVRRSFDIVLGLSLALVTAPFVLLGAAIVCLTSRGPAFYSQVRITRGGEEFRIHKIRSMILDAEPDGQAVWPEEADPRITPVGRFLRRIWLDELPQLLNVLCGSMSLVGPRPERPSFVKGFSKMLPNYPLRHQVKAGVTGLSQVLGYTGNTSLRRRLHLDLRYVSSWTPLLDLKLLVATILRIVTRMFPDSRGSDVQQG